MPPRERTDGRDVGECTTVLVVEDDPDIADLYRGTVADAGYDVRVAGTAAAATAAVDDDVDVALLDRRLPDGSGSGVLDAWAAAGHDLSVAMVTAVEPDFDIVEMGFDLYLVKPLNGDRIVEAVEALAARRDYGEKLRESASLAAKRAALRARKDPEELQHSDRYQRLLDRIEELDAALETLDESLEPADYRSTYRELDRERDQQEA